MILRQYRYRCVAAWVILAVVALANPVKAQVVQQAIGGVRIDAQGIVERQSTEEMERLRRERQAALSPAEADLTPFNASRKISLRKLEEVLRECKAKNRAIPDEARYLAGLQAIHHVFVYPERGDIVLAGPGEGWEVNHEGTVVGLTTHMPVLQLEDLLVALRAADAMSKTGITCSIEPTAEGMARLREYFHDHPGFSASTAGEAGEVLGPQNVLVDGVPADSRFASVLVAADYRMKRLAMGFDAAPIEGLPSFMDLTERARLGNMMPRWWLAAAYEPLLRDEEGLSWEIRGASVKTMTEQDVFSDGKRQASGKSHPLARKWAEIFTAKYEELSVHDSIFRELRNCMDLAIVSALIFRHHLDQQAGLSLAFVLDEGELASATYPTPRQVDTLTSVRQKRGGWEISASGGVDVDPWGIAARQETTAELAGPRSRAVAVESAKWWWN
jgi:hypothetical protein